MPSIGDVSDWIPGWILQALNFGQAYPKGKEDALFTMATAMHDLADELRQLEADAKAVTDQVAQYYTSSGSDQVQQELNQLYTGDSSISKTADAFGNFGDYNQNGGMQIEYSKGMEDIFAVMTLQMIWALLPELPWSAPWETIALAFGREAVERVATETAEKLAADAAEAGLKDLLKAYFKKITMAEARKALEKAAEKSLLKKLAYAGVKGGLHGMALDGGLQGYQIVAGHRSGFDWKQSLSTGFEWAAGGAVGVPVGHNVGKLFKRFAPEMAPRLNGILTSAAGGLAGGAGMYGASVGLNVAGQLLGSGHVDWSKVPGFNPQMLIAGMAMGGLHGTRGEGSAGAVADPGAVTTDGTTAHEPSTTPTADTTLEGSGTSGTTHNEISSDTTNSASNQATDRIGGTTGESGDHAVTAGNRPEGSTTNADTKTTSSSPAATDSSTPIPESTTHDSATGGSSTADTSHIDQRPGAGLADDKGASPGTAGSISARTTDSPAPHSDTRPVADTGRVSSTPDTGTTPASPRPGIEPGSKGPEATADTTRPPIGSDSTRPENRSGTAADPAEAAARKGAPTDSPRPENTPRAGADPTRTPGRSEADAKPIRASSRDEPAPSRPTTPHAGDPNTIEPVVVVEPVAVEPVTNHVDSHQENTKPVNDFPAESGAPKRDPEVLRRHLDAQNRAEHEQQQIKKAIADSKNKVAEAKRALDEAEATHGHNHADQRVADARAAYERAQAEHRQTVESAVDTLMDKAKEAGSDTWKAFQDGHIGKDDAFPLVRKERVTAAKAAAEAMLGVLRPRGRLGQVGAPGHAQQRRSGASDAPGFGERIPGGPDRALPPGYRRRDRRSGWQGTAVDAADLGNPPAPRPGRNGHRRG